MVLLWARRWGAVSRFPKRISARCGPAKATTTRARPSSLGMPPPQQGQCRCVQYARQGYHQRAASHESKWLAMAPSTWTEEGVVRPSWAFAHTHLPASCIQPHIMHAAACRPAQQFFSLYLSLSRLAPLPLGLIAHTLAPPRSRTRRHPAAAEELQYGSCYLLGPFSWRGPGQRENPGWRPSSLGCPTLRKRQRPDAVHVENFLDDERASVVERTGGPPPHLRACVCMSVRRTS